MTFDHLASVYEEYTGKIAVENLRPSWLIFSDGFPQDAALLLAAKRALDVVLAAIGLHHRLRRHAAIVALADEAHVARTGALSPGACRPERPDFHGPQVPDDARRTPRRPPGRCGARDERSARHAARQVSPPDAARRAAAALERAEGRDELCRAAARAAGVRQPADRDDSVLRPAPRRQARV